MMAAEASVGRSAFADSAMVPQSWYVLGRARDVRRNRPQAYELGRRRIVAYRDAGGGVNALDARCPHLGADLAQGRVDGRGLVCAFHGWQIDPDGSAAAPDGRCTRTVRRYPTFERYGLVWIFNGPRVAFAIPAAPIDASRTVLLPAQTLRCHPHLVVGNGIDVGHIESLHRMRAVSEPRVSRIAQGVAIDVEVEPCNRQLRGLLGNVITARFSAIGGSVAWASFASPLDFAVLFTGRPTSMGHCVTQTAVMFASSSPVRWLRAAVLLTSLLRADRRMLEGLDFTRRFAPGDSALAMLADHIDHMEVW